MVDQNTIVRSIKIRQGQVMISVRDFGAVGDGQALDSPGIQEAIERTAQSGGGTVHIPAGTYRCGTIELRSGITLQVDPGATIRASHDIGDFPRDNRNADIHDHHGRHLILARNCERVRLTGGGTIDGQGPAFWEPQSSPRAWIRPKPDRISPCLEFEGCRDVSIEDIHIVESPGWTLHLSRCDRARIHAVQIDNHRFGPNNDGFDINGCRDVQISQCRIDTCDDAIVLKTSRDSRSCERVTISDCLLSSNCVAIKCGTESWHDFRQITVTNCAVTRSTRAFGLYGFDGGSFEQIYVSNLVCDTDVAFVLNHPLHLDARKRNPDSIPSVMRDIRVSGFSARTDGRILMTTADGCVIDRVVLDGVHLSYPLFCDPAPVAPGATSAQSSRHSPEARAARAAIVADGIHRLRIRDLEIDWPESSLFRGWGGGETRIENGGNRRFGPADVGDDVSFEPFWGRNLVNPDLPGSMHANG